MEKGIIIRGSILLSTGRDYTNSVLFVEFPQASSWPICEHKGAFGLIQYGFSYFITNEWN